MNPYRDRRLQAFHPLRVDHFSIISKLEEIFPAFKGSLERLCLVGQAVKFACGYVRHVLVIGMTRQAPLRNKFFTSYSFWCTQAADKPKAGSSQEDNKALKINLSFFLLIYIWYIEIQIVIATHTAIQFLPSVLWPTPEWYAASSCFGVPLSGHGDSYKKCYQALGCFNPSLYHARAWPLYQTI